MPPATLTRLKQRIGDLGLPRVVWPVYCQDGQIVAFYDRDKAAAWAEDGPQRLAGQQPLQIKDASQR
jgi:hypothetical protein